LSKTDATGLSELLDITIANGESGALDAAGGGAVGAICKGRVIELALYIQARYFALSAALTGYGVSKAGEFLWQFTDSFGKNHQFRFDVANNVLKHNTSGFNFGIPHHQNLQRFIEEMLRWSQDGMPYP
jgi:hypothetical protein